MWTWSAPPATTGILLFAQFVGQATHGGDMQAVMGQLELAGAGEGRFPALQGVAHAGREQAVLDGIEPLRALGVPAAHVVPLAVRMGEIPGFVHH
jgi:hypothetical protein